MSRIRDEAARDEAALAGWFGVCLALGIVLLFAGLIRCSVESPLCDGSGRGVREHCSGR
jgi:hypothetical protein